MSDIHLADSRNDNPENLWSPSEPADDFLEQYAAAIRAEQAPARAQAQLQEALKARTAMGAEQTRLAGAADGSAERSKPVGITRRPRRTVRYAIAAASTAVLILAGAGAITLGADSSHSANPAMPTIEQQAGSLSDGASGSPAGNFFVLKAWADEAPTDEQAAREPVSVNWLHPQYWDSSYDPDAPAVNGPTVATGIARTTFHFDALCEGENLAAVTWTIDAPDAWFSYNGEDAHSGEADALSKSFTIDYDDSASLSAAEGRYLNVIAPLSDNLRENSERLGSDPVRYWSELVPAGYAEAARALDGAMLSLTATFQDGSTQTKAYRIGLVGDLDERCLEAVRAVTAQWEGNNGKVSDPEAIPSPFTLTLVSAS